jgi:hypothetical protein
MKPAANLSSKFQHPVVNVYMFLVLHHLQCKNCVFCRARVVNEET